MQNNEREPGYWGKTALFVARVAVIVAVGVTIILVFIAGFVLLKRSGACISPSLTTVSGRLAPKGKICSGQLIFEDLFQSFSKETWDHETDLNAGFNGEFEWYTEDERNSFVRNGKLYIQPTFTTEIFPDLTKCNIVITTPCTGKCSLVCSATDIAPPLRSARINSKKAFAFMYGRVQMSAKLPTGDWLWPAVWLSPLHKVYGPWPQSGDIDLVESRGNRKAIVDGEDIGVGQCWSALRFGTNKDNEASAKTSKFKRNAPGLNDGFHLYQLDWTPDKVTMSLDGVEYGSVLTGDGFYKRGEFSGPNPWATGGPNAPFDQEFFFIMNLAVGATSGYFADSIEGKPWKNWPKNEAMAAFWSNVAAWNATWQHNADEPQSTALQVDYIKVFAL